MYISSREAITPSPPKPTPYPFGASLNEKNITVVNWKWNPKASEITRLVGIFLSQGEEVPVDKGERKWIFYV